MKRVALPGGEMHHYNAMVHFTHVISGAIPAYRSSYTVTLPSGPFPSFSSLLQKALLQLDRSRPYLPIVMQPYHLKEGESGFYSCRCPSLPGARPDKPETYLSLIEGYRDVISSFKGDVAETLNFKSLTLFSPAPPPPRNPDDVPRTLPRGVTPVENLALGDFLEGPSGRELSATIYLKSPFLVSCIRLTRSLDARMAATGTH